MGEIHDQGRELRDTVSDTPSTILTLWVRTRALADIRYSASKILSFCTYIHGWLWLLFFSN